VFYGDIDDVEVSLPCFTHDATRPELRQLAQQLYDLGPGEELGTLALSPLPLQSFPSQAPMPTSTSAIQTSSSSIAPRSVCSSNIRVTSTNITLSEAQAAYEKAKSKLPTPYRNMLLSEQMVVLTELQTKVSRAHRDRLLTTIDEQIEIDSLVSQHQLIIDQIIETQKAYRNLMLTDDNEDDDHNDIADSRNFNDDNHSSSSSSSSDAIVKSGSQDNAMETTNNDAGSSTPPSSLFWSSLSPSATPPSIYSLGHKWTCAICTYINEASVRPCISCGYDPLDDPSVIYIARSSSPSSHTATTNVSPLTATSTITISTTVNDNGVSSNDIPAVATTTVSSK
jgi:hypothetical protein